MGIRFIGHKKKLLPEILDIIDGTVGESASWVADLFAGTGSVSAGLKREGYHVVGNDILTHCVTSTKAQLINEPNPDFSSLIEKFPQIENTSNTFIEQNSYQQVLSHLNCLEGEKGFFYSNYSPGGTQELDDPRRYFTDENAKMIDTIRSTIRHWHKEGGLDDAQHALLLHDLITAVNEVANTAGTYGAYLKSWYDRAKDTLQLTPTDIPPGPTNHKIFQQDANELANQIDVDAVYLDPPYTKRQYASYYHIPETIAEEDSPEITGKTGLRPWGEKSSDYCHKKRAPDKLRDLISRLDIQYVFLSYSTDGHIDPETTENILSDFGSFERHDFNHPRYKSNHEAKSGELTEFLYAMELE